MFTNISGSSKLWTVLFYHLQLFAEVFAINVALNKNVTDCLDNQLSNIMVDGIKDPDKFETTESRCMGRESYVEVFLRGAFAIHYVIIFAGNATKPGQLDYFMVRMYQGSFLALCGDYPGPSKMSDIGMRVNCAPTDLLHDTVQILSRKKEGLCISEIEVHSLASAEPDVRPMHYRGCYQAFGDKPRVLTEPLIMGCLSECARTGYLFFAVMNNEHCYCESNYDEKDEVPLDNCDLTCTDKKGVCGGDGFYSVYLGLVRLPSYLGCYKKGDTSDETVTKGEMTITKCMRHCDDYNYALLEGGDTCFCINDTISSDVKDYSACSSVCTGDPNELCGGPNHVAVYETCLRRGQESIKCTQLLNCAGEYNQYGECKGCKSGFGGANCLERIPRVSKMSFNWIIIMLQLFLVVTLLGFMLMLLKRRMGRSLEDVETVSYV